MRIIFSVIIYLATSYSSIAADMTGIWVSDTIPIRNEYGVSFTPSGNSMCGYFSWLDSPGPEGDRKKDAKNRNPALRDRTLLGLPVLGQLVEQSANIWRGRFYYIGSGRSHDITLKFSQSQPNSAEICSDDTITLWIRCISLRRLQQASLRPPVVTSAACNYQE